MMPFEKCPVCGGELMEKEEWFEMKIKGRLVGKSIMLDEPPPEGTLEEGERVEVVIITLKKKTHRFPIFKLGIKGEYLEREKIYGEA